MRVAPSELEDLTLEQIHAAYLFSRGDALEM